MRKQDTRKSKLIIPRLQLRVAGVFLTTALVATVVQAVGLNILISDLGERLPNDGALFASEWPRVMATTLLLSAGIMIPLMLGIGISATFRFAGPIHRFKEHIKSLLSGDLAPRTPVAIRKQDDFKDLCALLNLLIEKMPVSEHGSTDGADADNVPAALPGSSTRKSTASREEPRS